MFFTNSYSSSFHFHLTLPSFHWQNLLEFFRPNIFKQIQSMFFKLVNRFLDRFWKEIPFFRFQLVNWFAFCLEHEFLNHYLVNCRKDEFPIFLGGHFFFKRLLKMMTLQKVNRFEIWSKLRSENRNKFIPQQFSSLRSSTDVTHYSGIWDEFSISETKFILLDFFTSSII